VRFDRRELAGAVADLGVLVPIGVTLVVANGLSATAVLLPAGLLYVTAALVYRLPIPVQPLKAFGAIAIAKGLGSDEIAAGALLMGAIFVVLGRTGFLDLASRAFPRAIVRGVQLTVGLLFLKIAWDLVRDPPSAFADHALAPDWALPLGVATLVLAFLLRRHAVTLALVALGLGVMLALAWNELALGPSAVTIPSIDLAALATAFTVLVLPQVPLSFANSCLATADAAHAYFGKQASRVRPGRLATTFGSADLLAGAIGGMPVCHGAGGLTAHYSFGARTGGAPFAMGLALLTLAVGAGAGLGGLLAAFPLPILAGLLATAGVLHIGLLRDVTGIRAWTIALSVGAIGFLDNLAIGLGVGLVLWWAPIGLRRLRAAAA
jgi:hypothetical protein